jgi:UDP-N-acetylmuramate--alanine ligase
MNWKEFDMFRNRARKIHFVGIGGIGMSGIAEVLQNLGYEISGSDANLSPVTERLTSLGVQVFQGHKAAQVSDVDVVVTSSAVQSTNPEVIEAHRLKIPVIRRAEMLAELMRLKYGIAIAGTHGKTTTTSLVATILSKGGFDPTMVIGGRLKSISSNARLGAGDYMVAEADESDGSFLHLLPTLAVVTNIDAEHLENWPGGLPQIVDGFVEFINKVPFYGMAVLCSDHPTVKELLPRVEKRFVTYGFATDADYCAQDIHVEFGKIGFTLVRQGEVRGRVLLNMIGRHNVLNALAAIAVADEVGVLFADICEALEQFEGVGRRFEIKAQINDIMVADDYGHHPAEIRATLEAAREAYPRRLLVAFQPHRYSRTRDLFADFVNAFSAADVVLMTDIYAAGEVPLEGISTNKLVEAMHKTHKHVECTGSVAQTAKRLAQVTEPGDLVLTLGAGFSA